MHAYIHTDNYLQIYRRATGYCNTCMHACIHTYIHTDIYLQIFTNIQAGDWVLPAPGVGSWTTHAVVDDAQLTPVFVLFIHVYDAYTSGIYVFLVATQALFLLQTNVYARAGVCGCGCGCRCRCGCGCAEKMSA